MNADEMMQLLQEDAKSGDFPTLDLRLQEHVQTSGVPRIQHPLMHIPFYSPAHNRMLNYGFHQKLRAFKDYIKRQEWMSLMNLIERPFRIPVFDKYSDRMSNEDYWTVLSWVYTDSENIDQHSDLMRDLLTSGRADRHFLMDTKERAALAAMSDEITVFKGFSDDYHWTEDFSFTLSLKTAKFFARRYGCKTPRILTAKVRRDKVLAYLTHRNEQEILADPEDVDSLGEVRIKPMPPTAGGAIHQFINRVVS